LFSFALSAFSALATTFTVLMAGYYTKFEIWLILVSLTYGVVGSTISVLIYGRKTSNLQNNF
jgi:multidrug efflux pump subunit AcrB